MSSRKIAILGANSHIAKGLILNFCTKTNDLLFLFGRSLAEIAEFIETEGFSNSRVHINSYTALDNIDYDAIINCVGLGTPSRLKANPSEIFSLTEHFDDLILNYLSQHKHCSYINFSSGAVYGDYFDLTVRADARSVFNLAPLEEKHYYGIAKLNSEAKHRAFKHKGIVDLRIFSYFSRFIDLNSGFLLSEIAKCLKTGTQFITDKSEIVRDYVGPDEVFMAIRISLDSKDLNSAFDVYSKKPVSKSELLSVINRKYGLDIVCKNSTAFKPTTGLKTNYFSDSSSFSKYGYTPTRTAIEVIEDELRHII